MFSRSHPLLTFHSCCIFIVDTEGVIMRTRVQRWGNSLAVRIPRSFATDLQLDHVTLVDGKLTIMPVAPTFTLDELLEGMTSLCH